MDGQLLDIRWIQSSNFSPVLLTIVVLLLVASIVFVVLINRYRDHHEKAQHFQDEADSLDLNSHDRECLLELVERYALEEPIKILCTMELFDRIAMHEMQRVLETAGSMDVKNHYIDWLYDVRSRIYVRIDTFQPKTKIDMPNFTEPLPEAA